MTEFNRTNVHVTKEQAAEIKEAISAAQETPVILLGGVDVSARAWQNVMKTIEQSAHKQGLPETNGWYGFDPESSEFLVMPGNEKLEEK